MDSEKTELKDLKIKNHSNRYWIIVWSVTALIALAIHFVFELRDFNLRAKTEVALEKLSLSVFLIALILLIGRLLEQFIKRRNLKEGDQYNLVRIVRLLAVIFIVIITISYFFQDLKTAAYSVALVSLVLGFALQAPILSFTGWIYIIFKSPYKVGDRIQVGKLRGDVIEINYLDTTVLEFSGDYLNNDRYSGRVMTFPNSNIFKVEIFNYSGPDDPFIWNETAVQIAYTADLEFVTNCLIRAAKADFGNRYKDIFPQVGQVWQPQVYFRVNEFAWLEAVISYPVKPGDTTVRRTGILKLALKELNEHPEKVKFPEGTAR